MNIFVLDENPSLAAQYQCDKHVVKMVLETAQLLSTVHHFYGTATDVMYKPTHRNHPCSKWLLESRNNYDWLAAHFHALLHEYEYRYGKFHKSYALWPHLVIGPMDLEWTWTTGGKTPFKLCMPDEYKVHGDPVQSYRNYYIGAKAKFAKWNKGRPAPSGWPL